MAWVEVGFLGSLGTVEASTLLLINLPEPDRFARFQLSAKRASPSRTISSEYAVARAEVNQLKADSQQAWKSSVVDGELTVPKSGVACRLLL